MFGDFTGRPARKDWERSAEGKLDVAVISVSGSRVTIPGYIAKDRLSDGFSGADGLVGTSESEDINTVEPLDEGDSLPLVTSSFCT